MSGVEGARAFLAGLIKEILPPSKYKALRGKVVEAIAEYKRPRYVDVGERITVLFEDAATVWFQIEESLLLEGEEGEGPIADAIKAYGPIVPRAGEVSLTLMVNLYSDEELRRVLPKYKGVEGSVYLIAEAEVAARPIFPEDYGPGAMPRSIHYLKAPAPPGDEWTLAIRHPAAEVNIKLSRDLIRIIKNSFTKEFINW